MGKKKAASLVHSLKTQENTHFKGHCIHSTLPTCMKHMTWCPGTHHSNLYRVGGPLQRALGDTGHPHCNILLTQSACTSFPVLIPCQLPSVPPVAGGLTNEPTKEVLQSITQHCEHTHLGTNKKCAWHTHKLCMHVKMFCTQINVSFSSIFKTITFWSILAQATEYIMSSGWTLGKQLPCWEISPLLAR